MRRAEGIGVLRGNVATHLCTWTVVSDAFLLLLSSGPVLTATLCVHTHIHFFLRLNFFRALLGSLKIEGEGTEICHILPDPTHAKFFSIIYIPCQSHTFCGLRYMYSDTSPSLWHCTEYFHCPKNPLWVFKFKIAFQLLSFQFSSILQKEPNEQPKHSTQTGWRVYF